MPDTMQYYFILIAILEADSRYNNNNNIVYNDTDDVVLTEDGFTYIKKEIMAVDLIVRVPKQLCHTPFINQISKIAKLLNN